VSETFERISFDVRQYAAMSEFVNEMFEAEPHYCRDSVVVKVREFVAAGEETVTTKSPTGWRARVARWIPASLRTHVEERRWSVCPHLEVRDHSKHIEFLMMKRLP
jgi:hypothetical protein